VILAATIGVTETIQTGVRRLYVFSAAFLLGLLAFETLVYIGMHRMKYANPPGSERELAFEGDSPAG
jgi:hypothetical protein